MRSRIISLAIGIGLLAMACMPVPPEAVLTPTAPAPSTTPTPAGPLAAALLAQARELHFWGDYDGAADLLVQVLERGSSAELREARMLLGESFARRGRWTSGAEVWRTLLAEQVSDAWRARALFWLARAHEASGSHAAAVETYAEFEALGTPAGPYATVRRAAQLQVLGRAAEAAAAYELVAAADVARGERAGSLEKAIALYQQLGEPRRALELYRRLLDLATDPGYRARILWEAAMVAEGLGGAEEARRYLQEIIRVAPGSPQALEAVAWLASSPAGGLDALAGARILLNAERWSEALDLVDTMAVPADPAGQAERLRLRGLALRGLGQLVEARAEMLAAVGLDPRGAAGLQARLDAIQTLGWLGDVAAAEAEYRALAAELPVGIEPGAAVALESLRRVAELRERAGDLPGAADARLELGRRAPASGTGQRALHLAGLSLLQQGRLAEAAAAWQLLADGNTGYERARGLFWAGRTLRILGDAAFALRWQEAVAAAPQSYYGVRAAEEFGGIPDGTLVLGAPIGAEAWSEAQAWIASWATPGTAVSETLTLQPEIAAGPVARALELEQLGLHTESINEWGLARDRLHDQPLQVLALAQRAYEARAASVALLCAQQIVRLAPENAQPPVAMMQLLYPTPYPELIVRESQAAGLDPRALLATFRQESLFDPGATSWVGARGLGQVMPDTGRGIAGNLGVAGFDIDWLYRPVVSIRFGAFYLGRRMQDMNGSLAGALAAYNGGLGNAQRWAGGSQVSDVDLYIEQIDFPETSGYVRAVLGNYGVYRRMYAAATP